MSAEQVLLGLIEAGAVLWVEEGRLRYRAPVGAVGPALRAEAAAHRAALVAMVNAGAALPRHREAWSEDLRHEFEERAAILTFEVGMARVAAELEAERLVRLRACATSQGLAGCV